MLILIIVTIVHSCSDSHQLVHKQGVNTNTKQLLSENQVLIQAIVLTVLHLRVILVRATISSDASLSLVTGPMSLSISVT